MSFMDLRAATRAMIAPGIAVIAMLMGIWPLFAGGTWVAVATTGLPSSSPGLCNPLLLTDGTVLAQPVPDSIVDNDQNTAAVDRATVDL
jgi:hypothetical protein